MMIRMFAWFPHTSSDPPGKEAQPDDDQHPTSCRASADIQRSSLGHLLLRRGLHY
jgi:hypothetical protein